MKILLDENISHSVIGPLRELGHVVESVNTLRLKGIDNGTLYREVARNFGLCLSRDAGFVESVRKIKTTAACKVLRLTIKQQPKTTFARVFIEAFQKTDWGSYSSGSDWPR